SCGQHACQVNGCHQTPRRRTPIPGRIPAGEPPPSARVAVSLLSVGRSVSSLLTEFLRHRSANREFCQPSETATPQLGKSLQKSAGPFGLSQYYVAYAT